MTDYLGTLLIMILVGLLVLIPSAVFGGRIGLIIAFVTITAVSCFFLTYALALGKSFSNSNSPTSWDWGLFLKFISFASLYAFIAYGAFCMSQYTNGAEGYKLKLIVWSLILVGYPLYLYSSEVYDQYYTHKKHYSSKITLAHPKDFPILIDQIRFFDSESKNSSSLYDRFRENFSLLKEFEGLREKNEDMQSQRYYTKVVPMLIPIKFNYFELSWYSLLENKFYKDTFFVDQEKLRIRENYDGQMVINDLLIHILPNGNVDLLKQEYLELIHLNQYYKVAFTSVDSQNLDALWKLFTPIRSPDADLEYLKTSFSKLQNDTKPLLSPEEILSFRSVHEYNIEIKINQKQNEVKEIKIIDFYLNQYTRSVNFLRKVYTKPLPSFIQIKLLNEKDERRWLEIVFDKKMLFNQFTNFSDAHKEKLSFDIKIDIEELNKTEIWLRSKDEKISLSSWRISER